HHDDEAEHGSLDAVADGIRAERRTDSALIEIFDRCRECAGTKCQRQVVSRFLAEITRDFAAVLNFALDAGSGTNEVVQNYGHLAADILLCEGPEAVCRIRREREIDLPHAGIRRA